MERLFWTQTKNPDTPNTLINSNGSIITLDRFEDNGYALFNELLGYQETSKTVYRSGNLILKKHPDGGVYISSNFSDKDEAGRTIGFMFFTKNTTKSEVIKDLLFFSGLVKKSLSDQDIKNIKRNIQWSNKQINGLVLAAIITILIIYMLWRKLN